jgi:hypothetical protein
LGVRCRLYRRRGTAVTTISSLNKPIFEEMIMERSTIAKTFAICAVAALALGMAPMAKAEPKECSVATLEGSYARTDTGFVAAGPLAGLSLMTFDGNGTFKFAGAASVNGVPGEAEGTGTYTVNPDCTGKYTSQFSTGRTGGAFFVITNNGNEIQILPTSPGGTLNCIARKVFPVGNPKD